MVDFFGKFHPLIVHLPIGIMFLNIVFVFLARRGKYADAIKNILPLTLLLGMASAILACATGWFLSRKGGYDDAILFKHQWLGISLAVLSVIIYVSKNKENKWLWLVMTGLLMLTGHFGGTLTHGENYLSFDSSLAGAQKKDEIKTKLLPTANVQESMVFQDWIQPILKEKCFSCHSATKQKGKLRLDSPDFILKGGAHGAIFKAGQPQNSEMLKRLLLDLNDEHRMPPKGKPQPTAQEIERIKLWIAEGASFEKKIKDLTPTDAEKNLFYVVTGSYLSLHKKEFSLSDIKIEKANDKILDSIRKSGITLIRIAPESNFLSANFASFSSATDSDVFKLLLVAPQLTALQLGGTKITDATLSYLNQMPNLTRLDLNNTNISEEGLVVFPELKNLSYLNLVNTKIGLKGLTALSNPMKLTQLQQLFLFNTKISPQDSSVVKKLFPNTKIDFGGYRVATLVSDTTLYKRK